MSETDPSQPRKPEHCPACQSKKVLRIFYGRPLQSTIDVVDRGEGVLGGCMVQPAAPDWKCGSCHHRWADDTDPVRQKFLEFEAKMLAKVMARGKSNP